MHAFGAGTGLAVVVALALTPSVATAAPNPSDYVLRQGTPPRSEALIGLTRSLQKRGVQELLTQPGNRRMAHQGACGGAAKVPSGADWWCFSAGDTKTRQWIPQGVSTVSDAQD